MRKSSNLSTRIIRMPPQKRRRLSTSSSVTSVSDVTSPSVLSPISDEANTSQYVKGGSVSCNGCRKYFNIGVDTKLGRIVTCTRCHATSCSVCSRVCNAGPPSIPPTPLLSFSPTPPITPLGSPSRRCQILSPDNMSTPVVSTTDRDDKAEGRKKKRNMDEMENISTSDVVDVDTVDNDLKNVQLTGTGCGRTFCRNCCVDNPQTLLSTCYDCYGLTGTLPSVC